MTNLTPVMSGRPAEYPLHEVWRARGWILGIQTPHEVRGAPRNSPPMMSGGAAGGIPKSKSPPHSDRFGVTDSADSVEGERGGADEEIKDKDKAAAG